MVCWKESTEKYFCTKCKRNHKFDSRIGLWHNIKGYVTTRIPKDGKPC